MSEELDDNASPLVSLRAALETVSQITTLLSDLTQPGEECRPLDSHGLRFVADGLEEARDAAFAALMALEMRPDHAGVSCGQGSA